MSNGPVFISHATSDDAFVSELRLALKGLHIPVWVEIPATCAAAAPWLLKSPRRSNWHARFS